MEKNKDDRKTLKEDAEKRGEKVMLARKETPKKQGKKEILKEKPLKNTRKIGVIILEMVGMTVWAGASIFISGTIFSFLFALIFGVNFSNDKIISSFYSLFYYVFAVILAILGPILVKNKLKKSSGGEKSDLRVELGLRELPTWTDIGLSIVGLIMAVFIATGVSSLLSNFSWFDAEETQTLIFSFSMKNVEKVAIFISLVIIAPIAEELIFRGWLYGKLREKSFKNMPEIISIVV